MKAWMLFLLLNSICFNAQAYILLENRSLGNTIHRTNIITCVDKELEVLPVVYIGNLTHTGCVYREIQPLQKLKLSTGDYLAFDSLSIKQFFGTNFSCMMVRYYSTQMSEEKFALLFDGNQYFSTYPSMQTVSIY